MNSRIKKISSVSMLALLMAFTPTIAIAQGTGQNQPTADETVQTTSVDDSTENEAANRKSRLEERKAALKTRLDAAKQARLKSRCKASQGKLSSISGRIKGLEMSRSQVYANVLDRLAKLNERLKSANVNTAELDEEITQLNTFIETFNTELAAYKVAVSDLAEMDCAADPTAFQASLEAARTARTKTADSAKAIRTYLSETVKPTLKELKAQFAENSGDQTEAGETE